MLCPHFLIPFKVRGHGMPCSYIVGPGTLA
jgi:hypothetical protein